MSANDNHRPTKPPRHKKRRRKAGRQEKLRAENTVEIIDRLLLQKIEITINGAPTRITVLAAIVFQLFQKELAGDARASRVLLKYQQITKRAVDKQVKLEFVDVDDTRSFEARADHHG